MLGKLNIAVIQDLSHDHLIAFFKQHENEQWACLLDSCQQTSMGGRFDIMAYAPSLTYQFTQGTHKLSGPCVASFSTNICETTKNPFEVLSNLHAQFAQLIDITDITHIPSDIPFLVGALAAFSYDTNISSDNILDGKPNQYEMDDINVGFYTSSVIYDNQSGLTYICSIYPDVITSIQNTLKCIDIASISATAFSLTSKWQSNVTEQEYSQNLSKIHDYLHAGDCYQVNYAQRFNANYQGSEFSAYETLREVNKAPFSAFFRLPNSCILSLSPERLLQLKDQHVETKPIKGTRKRSIDPIEDKRLANELLSSEKDKAENLMIVDLLRNDISKHCMPHSVKVPKLFALESYPAVHHMVSTVIGTLKPSSSPYDLLEGAFPGGSITGAPKVRAMQIIQELEPDKRAIYCGSVGYIGIRYDMDTNICIRTLLAEKNTLYCWGGGGIVIDSQAADEYQESLHKLAKILPILNS
ncbi:aminodeoxychorismate synthase component I [Glaciecola sp. 2405UD65-10]|uniref:aminodeoxychorismate synthase component I n=1 Tax=Glaciecola sp. 2405UD65-10 TaxID=3397244 RepID=UPI003B5A4DF4